MNETDIRDNSQFSYPTMNNNRQNYYKKPTRIQNIKLLRDPHKIDIDQDVRSNGNNGKASPLSIGPTASPTNMNSLYINLKDDLIEHHDYEAVSQPVF